MSSIRQMSSASLALMATALWLCLDVSLAFSTLPGLVSAYSHRIDASTGIMGRIRGGPGRMQVDFLQGLSMMSRLPRRRRGKGPQRSRWAPREVSEDIEKPQEIGGDLGEGGNRMAKIEALAARKYAGFIVVLEDPHDEGNAGAVIRSCDAFGVSEVWFVHNGLEEGTSMRPHVERFEPFVLDSRELLLSSASANRWVVSKSFRSTKVALTELKKEGYVNVATCFTSNSVSLYQADLSAKKIALWMGNEYEGLSQMAIDEADIQLFIPMRGMIQSLNLSVATSVCLNEICRQRSISDKSEEYVMQPDEQKNIVRQLSMKRRGFRQGGMTDAKNERLKRTWATMVRKSLKKGSADVGQSNIDYSQTN